MNNPLKKIKKFMIDALKKIKKFMIDAFKTKEEKHKEFIHQQFNDSKILKVGGVKNE